MPEIDARQDVRKDLPPEPEMAAINPCCQDTLRLHAANNPMMVCGDCKQIIKVFRDSVPYRNYLRFCKSRHRKVLSSIYGELWVVIFKSYETT